MRNINKNQLDTFFSAKMSEIEIGKNIKIKFNDNWFRRQLQQEWKKFIPSKSFLTLFYGNIDLIKENLDEIISGLKGKSFKYVFANSSHSIDLVSISINKTGCLKARVFSMGKFDFLSRKFISFLGKEKCFFIGQMYEIERCNGKTKFIPYGDTGLVKKHHSLYLNDEYYFVCLVLFMQVAEIYEEIIPERTKQKIFNTTVIDNRNIEWILLNINFLKRSIRTDSYSVSGHFRWQACGKNWKDRKLIFIESYQKDGYVIEPKK